MPHLKATATRWASDEPIPGWVEVEFYDADGIRHVLADKPPIFGGAELNAYTQYPVEVLVACVIVAPADDDGRLRISTGRPWGVSTLEGHTEFVVRGDQVLYE